MKVQERLRILFESEQDAATLEEWLDIIEKKYIQSLLNAQEADLLKAKHEYEAAKRFRRYFIQFFDKRQ